MAGVHRRHFSYMIFCTASSVHRAYMACCMDAEGKASAGMACRAGRWPCRRDLMFLYIFLSCLVLFLLERMEGMAFLACFTRVPAAVYAYLLQHLLPAACHGIFCISYRSLSFAGEYRNLQSFCIYRRRIVHPQAYKYMEDPIAYQSLPVLVQACTGM